MGPNSSQQITAAIIQQQNRAIAQQNLEKFNSMSNMEKQRLFKQFDKKQFDAPMLHSDNSHSRSHDRTIQASQLPSRSPQVSNSNAPLDLQQPTKPQTKQQTKQPISHKVYNCPFNTMAQSLKLNFSFIFFVANAATEWCLELVFRSTTIVAKFVESH